MSIASSSDGKKLVAVNLNGYIYTSTDSGATWAEHTEAGKRRWLSITSSSDGTKLAAVVDKGYIYTNKPYESNYGYLWVNISAENKGDEIAKAPSSYYMKILVSGVKMKQDVPLHPIPNLYDDID